MEIIQLNGDCSQENSGTPILWGNWEKMGKPNIGTSMNISTVNGCKWAFQWKIIKVLLDLLGDFPASHACLPKTHNQSAEAMLGFSLRLLIVGWVELVVQVLHKVLNLLEFLGFQISYGIGDYELLVHLLANQSLQKTWRQKGTRVDWLLNPTK